MTFSEMAAHNEGALQVRVWRVEVPAFSTIGYGWGEDERGRHVHFAGDHRAMAELCEAVVAGHQRDELPVAEVEPYQVLSVQEVQN